MNAKLSGVNPHFGHIQTVNAARNITHLPIVDVKCNYVLPHTIEGSYVDKVLMPPNKVPQHFRYTPFHYYSNSARELLEEDFDLVSPSDQIWQKGSIQWQEGYVPSDHEIAGVGYKALTDYKTYAPNENGVLGLIDIYAHVNDNGKIRVNFPKSSTVWIKGNLESVTQPYIWVSGYNRHQVQAWLSEHNIQDPFLMRSMVELFLSGQPITRETLRSCGFRIENQNTANEHAYLPLPDGTYLQWKPGYNLDSMQAWEASHPPSPHRGYQYPAKQTLSYLSVHQDPHTNTATDGMLNATDLRNAGFVYQPHASSQRLWTRGMNTLSEQSQPLVHVWIPNKTRTEMDTWYDKHRAQLPRNYRLPAYLPGSEMDRALNATGHFGKFIVTEQPPPPIPKPAAKPTQPPKINATQPTLSQELFDSLTRLKHYRSKTRDTHNLTDSNTASSASSEISSASTQSPPAACSNFASKQIQTDEQPVPYDTTQIGNSLSPFAYRPEKFWLSPKGRVPTPPPFKHLPPTPPPFTPEMVITQDSDFHSSASLWNQPLTHQLEPRGKVPSPPLFKHMPPTPPPFFPSLETSTLETSTPLTRPAATQFLQQAEQERAESASSTSSESSSLITQVRSEPSLRPQQPRLWTSALRYDGTLAFQPASATMQPRVRFELPNKPTPSKTKDLSKHASAQVTNDEFNAMLD